MTEPSREVLNEEQWESAARYLAGECSPAEARAFEAWLAGDPAREQLLAELRATLAHVRLEPAADLDVEGALRRVHDRMTEGDVVPIHHARAPRVPAWQRPWLRVAAMAMLVIGSVFLYRALRSPGVSTGTLALQTWQTVVGTADTIALPDGTIAVLGPNSRLTAVAGYNRKDRRLELDGVAYFTVTHDATRPFTVVAGTASVTDLGTAFTVRADSLLPVSVAVTQGSVRLSPNATDDAGVILVAGQRGTIRAGQAVVEADTVGALAWTRGRLVFSDAPFAEVAAELRRWYGVALVAGDSAVAARHLTSEFAGESLQSVVDVIALALAANAERTGDTIVLHSTR